MPRPIRYRENPLQAASRVIRSTVTAVASAGLGSIGGALGLGYLAYKRTSRHIVEDRLAADPETEDASEKTRLLSTVQNNSMVRNIAKGIIDHATQAEYDARKKLEAMGYLPCSECGTFHPGQQEHAEDHEDDDDDDASSGDKVH